jgi:hypothetical protein
MNLDQNQINFALVLWNFSSSVSHLDPLEMKAPTRLMQTMGDDLRERSEEHAADGVNRQTSSAAETPTKHSPTKC